MLYMIHPTEIVGLFLVPFLWVLVGIVVGVAEGGAGGWIVLEQPVNGKGHVSLACHEGSQVGFPIRKAHILHDAQLGRVVGRGAC